MLGLSFMIHMSGKRWCGSSTSAVNTLGRFAQNDGIAECHEECPSNRRQLRETLLIVYGYTTDDYQRILLTPFVELDHDEGVIP